MKNPTFPENEEEITRIFQEQIMALTKRANEPTRRSRR